MGKNNKVRRVQKKRKKAELLKKLKIQRMHNNDTLHPGLSTPVFGTFDNPLQHLTDDQRKELAREIGERSKQNFQDSLSSLQTMLRTYDPMMLLASISTYGLTTGASDKGVQFREDQDILNQSHVEILQALILQIPIPEWGQELVPPSEVQNAFDTLKALCSAFSFSRFSSDRIDASEKDKAIGEIQEWIRGNTQSVRNWGFYSQVLNISDELYGFFDDVLLEKYGFKATHAIKVFDYMIQSIESSLTQRHVNLAQLKAIKRRKELILKYHELIGQGQEEADAFYAVKGISKLSIKNLFIMLLSHYDLGLSACFHFTVESVSAICNIDLENIKVLLDHFSYSPGDLAAHKAEYLFLDNPIWNKPIIKNGEDYFCPMPQLFFSFILSSLDEIIEKINKDGLHDRRADYLEEKIEEIVKRRFPDALTVSGLKWRLSEDQYETDLITFIDSHAIIIEAKSQKISKPALRGAPDRIKRHIREILVEPSIQSKRLENRLNELRLDPTLNDELRDKLPVGLNNIHKVLRVSVTLEDFASLQSNFSRFIGTEWLPDNFYPCPTMNLADFETLFDFLEHPVQIIHYLQRRTELEGHINFVGDELDMMGLYTMTLFNLGNIQAKDHTHLVISAMSFPLDNYYMSRNEGIIIEKPRPRISKLFNEIFSKLEERSTPQWTEIGVLLNRFSPDDQAKLATSIETLKRGVNRTWQTEGHKNTIILVPPEASEYALAYVLFKNGNSQRRYEFINNAAQLGLEPDHVEYCLVIAKNIDHDDPPYHYIALVSKSSVMTTV